MARQAHREETTATHTPDSIRMKTGSHRSQPPNENVEDEAVSMVQPKENTHMNTNRSPSNRPLGLRNSEAPDSGPISKDGTPDRRYKGQRDLPDELPNPDYTKASTGDVIEGIHITKDGKPDRRFMENRALDEEEARIKQAELILAQSRGDR
jgi:hypothetical protein